MSFLFLPRNIEGGNARAGRATRELLRLVRSERKRMVRARWGWGPAPVLLRWLDHYALLPGGRRRWGLACLEPGPSRQQLVRAVDALWAKRKEQCRLLRAMQTRSRSELWID
jgi:hypothetical protein